MKIGDLFIKLGLQKGEFDKGIDDAKRKTSSFGSAMGKIGGMIAGVFAVGAITGFISNIIKTRSEFEKYKAVLTNALGSERQARQEMQMLQEVAAKTPFSLTELTGAYVKLVNYGLKPTKEEIIKLGDLASSTGKGFDQLVEGVADAVTGQYERLKEFGIKASKEGAKVTFTFKEQKTAVDNNAQSIKAYLIGLGDLQGVSGAMAAISETLGGKISNLGDNWDKLLNTLGGSTSGIFTTVISWLSTLIEYLTKISTTIDQIRSLRIDVQTKSNIESAKSEIDAIKESLLKKGLSEEESQKKSLELYKKGMQDRIALAQASRKEGASDLKQSLITERNEILKYYSDIEKSKQEKTKDSGEIIKKIQKEIADQTKALSELPKKSIAYYEAEISLLHAKQKLITNPQLIEKSKTEIALKKDLLDQLTKELSFLELKKTKIEDIRDVGYIQESPKDRKDSSQLDISQVMKTDMFNSDNAAKLYQDKIDEAKNFVDELNDIISSGIADAINTMASGFGELAAGEISGAEFGKQILSVIGKFMQTLGGLFIAYAINAALFAESVKNPLAWPVALAAGVAMVAAGAAISSFASKGMSGGSSASHAASGYSNYNASSGTAALSGNVVFELEGTKLRGALNNTDRRNNLIR